MPVKKSSRVVFYSKIDIAAVPNLEKAEALLEHFNMENGYDINDILEIYHVKQYFDHDLFLQKWTQEELSTYKTQVEEIWAVTKLRLLEVDDSNIGIYLDLIGYEYMRSFWSLIEMMNIYKKLGKSNFSMILDKYDQYLHYILYCPIIVNYFNSEIKVFLLSHKNTAEMLLRTYEEKGSAMDRILHFPKSLTLSEKEAIIESYVESPGANLNYIRLITGARDSANLKISPKVRLKAQRRAVELNNQILEKGYTWTNGVGVGIAKNQEEPIIVKRNGNNVEKLYSEDYLNNQIGFLALFNVFANLFHYTDKQKLIRLVSYPNELDVMESIGMKSKNEYVKGSSFVRKKMESDQQLIAYNFYLESRDLSAEIVIKGFLTELTTHFKLDGFRFEFPSATTSYLEKIRVLAPDFEFILRQYKNFVEDGFIDFELLELQSSPINFSEIPSLCDKKYAYMKDEEVIRLKNQFFSPHSHLYYINPYKDRYRNLFSLLFNEDVKATQFENYQLDEIKNLINKGYLYITEQGFIKLKKVLFVIILGNLYQTDVISYWNYPVQFREVIDEMVNDGFLTFENKLFTRNELKYLNFYLNKKEFTNGLDLRNKYLHGTNSSSEKIQKEDYLSLLKILILVLIKIQDDLVNSTYKDIL